MNTLLTCVLIPTPNFITFYYNIGTIHALHLFSNKFYVHFM